MNILYTVCLLFIQIQIGKIYLPHAIKKVLKLQFKISKKNIKLDMS